MGWSGKGMAAMDTALSIVLRPDQWIRVSHLAKEDEIYALLGDQESLNLVHDALRTIRDQLINVNGS
jgi:hypothetical protein